MDRNNLGEWYDLTATGPTEPVPTDPQTHCPVRPDNPFNYRAWYPHNFTVPADPTTDKPATPGRIWYEINFPDFVKRFPELQEEYVSDRLTIRAITDLTNEQSDSPWDQILADLNAATAVVKPVAILTPFDLGIQILYQKQSLAAYTRKYQEVLKDRDAIFTASEKTLQSLAADLEASLKAKGSGRGDQRDDQQFLLDHNTSQRQAIEKVIAACNKLLANWLTIWSECGLADIDFDQPDDLKSLGLPQVVTKGQVEEVKARLAAQRAESEAMYQRRLEEAAKKPKSQLPSLNQALAADLVEPMPESLLQPLVTTWFNECLQQDIGIELHKYQDSSPETCYRDRAGLLRVLQKYTNLVTDLTIRLPAP